MDRRGKYLLHLKAVRHYIAENPGCTNAEIVSKVGHGTSGLQGLGLAFWKRGEDGEARWYVKPNLSRPWLDKDKEDNYEMDN